MAKLSVLQAIPGFLGNSTCFHSKATLKLLAIFSTIVVGLLLLMQRHGVSENPVVPPFRPRKHDDESNNAFAQHPAVECFDHIGNIVPASTGIVLNDHDYPDPTFGSFDALGLPRTWMSFRQRYGCYGFANKTLSQELTNVDWGSLQDDCLVRNKIRFPGRDSPKRTQPRFRLHEDYKPTDQDNTARKRNRQAIVLRTWSTYKYQDEDLWNVRSIIAEASFATGAEYEVFLLVDVKDEESRIHDDDAEYERVLQAAVPAEFRSISVLWHSNLLESWYKKVPEHRSFWQIMQPFQLFAHLYPEFDHYWQFEMDTRFTGHVGELLRSLNKFGKEQPYKQARERASWRYMQSAHGSYNDFSRALNETLQGSATVWGPIEEAAVTPIGQPPPSTAEEDDFQWGVNSDADLLLLGPLNDVRRFEHYEDWVSQGWHGGFATNDPPRFMSVPAQARASWELLESIHLAQHEQGLHVPSEATLPTFALLHGLKVIGIPTPIFQYPERNLAELDYVQNGGGLADFPDGIANGPSKYRSSSLAFFQRPLTLDWVSPLCDPVFEWWRGDEGAKGREQNGYLFPAIPDEPPSWMAFVNGTAYLPSLLLHPRKTSHYRAPER